ncbi:hypothetical protein CYMTET_10898 [Cymbomonas tetramitiformis]|uniref:Uncharacterized protein n=1 Tax=Cymbomonas tetramitiformis TaxID=36881 RepID=A0AAE0GN86_9CHLO|nr:hypothetical protein CYMTET_10898 [Cymbomonas tetramitiformis]
MLASIGLTCEALRKQIKREADTKAKRSTSESGMKAVEDKRMLPSDTLKRISEGVSARSLKRKAKAFPTPADRQPRKAAVAASNIIGKMDLANDDDVNDDDEIEYVGDEEDDVESDREDQVEEEAQMEDANMADDEEIIKSLAVEGKVLAVRSGGDEVFLFITTDGIKEGATRVPGGFLRELVRGASYGRNAQLKDNEILFNADKETQKRVSEMVAADPTTRYFTRWALTQSCCPTIRAGCGTGTRDSMSEQAAAPTPVGRSSERAYKTHGQSLEPLVCCHRS